MRLSHTGLLKSVCMPFPLKIKLDFALADTLYNIFKLVQYSTCTTIEAWAHTTHTQKSCGKYYIMTREHF